MRLLLAVVLAFHPLAAQAQSVRLRAPAAGLSGSLPAPAAALPSFQLQGLFQGPALTAPGLPSASFPALLPGPMEMALPQALQPGPMAGLGAAASAVSQDAPRLDGMPAESAGAAAQRQFLLLGGARHIGAVAESAEEPDSAALLLGGGILHARGSLEDADAPPLPPEPERKASVRKMFLGTAVYKLGMEAVTLGFPLFALQALGGAAMVATLVVVYGLAQAASSSLAGGLTDRFPASRVISRAVAVQAAFVLAAAVLAWAGALGAGAALVLYGLIGGTVGIVETSRRLVPPLILGTDAKALAQYNARLHIYYEVAGVGGALLAGLVLWTAGTAAALLIPPLPFLAAAAVFSKVRHGFSAAAGPSDALPPSRKFLERVKAYLDDLKLGAKTVLGDPYYRWAAVAIVLPQVVHRIFEGVLVPVYAKGVLGQGALASAVLAASNFGELVGAWLLLRRSSGERGPARWVRLSALGLLAAWSFGLAAVLPLPLALAVLLPSIVVFSLTWAAADLRLLTDLQHRLPEKERSRALSFLYGLFMVSVTFGSLGLGRFLDALSLSSAFLWIQAGITAIAVLVWLAYRRLKSTP